VPQRSSGVSCPLARRISARSREHLLDAERLRDVIVRTAVDALHLLVPASARGQHQHRDGEARVPPAPQDRQAVDLGEPEVQHDGVVPFRLAKEVGALAVGGAIHRVAGIAERARELRRQQRFIFDDQDPHFIVIAQTTLNDG